MQWLKFMMKVAENSIGRKLLEKYGPFILNNVFNTPVTFKSVLDPLLSATTVVNGGTVEVSTFLYICHYFVIILFCFHESKI